MKRTLLMIVGMLGLGISIAQSQTLLNSWEDSLEGWSVANTTDFTSVGFSTNNGVTDGTYSWEVQNTTGGYIWDQVGSAPDLQGPYSTELTAQLGNATSVTWDIYLPAGNFGWGIGFSLYLDQPGGAGPMIISQWENWSGLGQTNHFTFNVPQSVRTAMLENHNLPTALRLATGGGGAGTMYLDNLRINTAPVTPAQLWVRELWDSIPQELIPADEEVTDNSSSAGFSATDPWLVNPAEVNNCRLMAFRSGFFDDSYSGDTKMALPTTLLGTSGALVQDNSHGTTAWTNGLFMTRLLNPECYINFQAAGEYWFSMTIANATNSQNAQYVNGPATGAGGIGFANGETTNAEFVAIGASGLNVSLGAGATDASKALYISQGTLGQPGDGSGGAVSLTDNCGGPYYISLLATQTVNHVQGDYLTLLGHLTTFGDGTATLDAKYYGTGVGGNPWNTELDTDPASITWDCSYSFDFDGTLTRMLLFQNGQFPFYLFGFRASTEFQDVVGLDPGYIQVSPLTDTYVGFAINMTNLAVEANDWSFASPPAGYGTLDYQWYRGGTPIGTEKYYNVASATLADAGTYTCVASDPSGTWGPVTNSVVINVTELADPLVSSVEMYHNGDMFLVTYDQPNLTGVDTLASYVFDNGIVVTNLNVVNSGTDTKVYLGTTPLPLGTKVSLTISGVTNVVGGTLASTNMTMWTDLIQEGLANWDGWTYALNSQYDYFNNFVPANPTPAIRQSMSLTSWEGPSTGVTAGSNNGSDAFGSKLYGWFVPPVTTNYVFYISCDDGGRLSLSTDETATNLKVIACESLWHGPNQWTNINNFSGGPHRGDGTATATNGAPDGYVWDNSVAGQSPATACLQNRSDQFIVAFYDSSGLPGGPPQATNDNWLTALSQVTDCVPTTMTNFWPNVDANGQALITLEAGQMYYMELEFMQLTGGYQHSVTYKSAGDSDPLSPSTTILDSSVIAGTVTFAPSISIAQTESGPVITYTGVLLAGPDVASITNVVAQSSASTAISLGGPSEYSPPDTGASMFYRTSE